MPRSANHPTLPSALTHGEKEALLQLITDEVSDVVALLDLHGRVLFISAAARELLGFDASILIGRKLTDSVSGTDQDALALALEQARHADHYHTVTLHMLHLNGCEVLVECRFRPLVNKIGTPVELAMSMRDIGDQHTLESRLRDSEATYRGILDSINEAVYILDQNNQFLDVNQGAVRMYGYPRDFFIGKTPIPLSAPGQNNLEATVASLSRAYAGEPQRFEFWGLRSNGDIFPKEVRLYPGSYFGARAVVAIAQDITERKATEELIARESRINETMLRAASDGIHVMDSNGNVVQLNDAFCRMLGYSREDLLRMNVADWDVCIPPEVIRTEFARMTDASITLETRHRRKDGSEFPVEISTVLMEIDGKRLIYASSRDITERKRTEEALQLAAQIYQSSSEAMMVTDAEQRIIAINPAFTAMTGYSAQEALGNKPRMLRSGRQDEAFYQSMWESLLRNNHWQGEIYNRRGSCKTPRLG